MPYQTMTPARLALSAITTSVTTVYTAPAATRALLKEMNIANSTASPIAVRIFIVPSGDSASTANAFVYDAAVGANNSLQYNGIEVLNPGDTLQVQAASLGLTITASGAEAV